MRVRRRSRFVTALSLATFLATPACEHRPKPERTPSSCASDRECPTGHACFDARCLDPRELAATVESSRAPAAPRTQFQGDARRTGRSPFRGPNAMPRELFAYRTQGRITASPLVLADGSILLASTDGTVTRIDPASGQARARIDLGAPIESTPAVSVDGTIWVAARTGLVVGLDPDLHPRSRTEVEGPVTGPLLLDEAGTLYVPGRGLHALDLRGRRRFTATRAVPLRGGATRARDGRVVFGTPEGTVVALEADGRVAWEVRVEASVDGSIAVTDTGELVVGNDLGHVLVLDPHGTVRAKVETEGDVRATAALSPDGTIVVGSYDSIVRGLSPDGSVRFTHSARGAIHGSALLDRDGRIYVGGRDEGVHALDAHGRLLFVFPLGADVDVAPVLGPDGTLYVAADDGALHALR